MTKFWNLYPAIYSTHVRSKTITVKCKQRDIVKKVITTNIGHKVVVVQYVSRIKPGLFSKGRRMIARIKAVQWVYGWKRQSTIQNKANVKFGVSEKSTNAIIVKSNGSYTKKQNFLTPPNKSRIFWVLHVYKSFDNWYRVWYANYLILIG